MAEDDISDCLRQKGETRKAFTAAHAATYHLASSHSALPLRVVGCMELSNLP